MIGFFPTPYPDELFYSVCARYSQVVKYKDSRDLSKELFSSVNASAIYDLPCNLNSFVLKLPINYCYTSEKIIDNLTLLPYYSPFLPRKIVEKTRQQMKTANCSGIHFRLGIMASRIKFPKYLKYCFNCLTEDLTQFGETYWHRSHQLPGVLICWKHKEKLGESLVRTNTSVDTFVYTPTRQLTFEPVKNTFTKTITDELWKISVMSNLLLFGKYPIKGKFELSNIYKEILIKKGLATYTKSLRVEKIIDEFSSFYPKEILTILGCQLKGKSLVDNNWLLQIFRKAKSVQHPLYHILVLNFLNIDIDNFFNYSKNDSYFGEPPWICLNPAASHYKQPVIREYFFGKRSRNGKPVGRFKCVCGFEYIRSGPDIKAEDKFRIDKMVNFGIVWENKLIELWYNNSFNLTAIARILNVDPLTIKKYATKLNLSFKRKNKNYKNLDEKTRLKDKNMLEMNKLLIEKREEWTELIKFNQKFKLKELRSLKPRLYAWLIENDSDWLDKNLPLKQILLNKSKSYVDWEKRDLDLKCDLEHKAKLMLTQYERPKQITKTALGKKTESLPLILTKLEKMPLTKATLDKLVESKEEYAIRKIRWVASNFRDQNLFPSKSQLIISACVYKMRENQSIKKVINQEFNRFRK